MQNRKIPKTILITQGELIKYAGSEIVTLELAEFFSQNGSNVHVLSSYIGPPIEVEFHKLKNVTLHTSTHGINFDRIDLVWIHHNLIPLEVIELAKAGLLKAKVVFHHMSSFYPLEAPFYPAIEQNLANLILFNSQLTKTAIESKTKDIKFAGKVFNNPAPEAYRLNRPTNKSKKLSKILVVSSHVPKEIIAATNTLRRKGIAIKFMGDSAGHDFRRVTSKDIVSADVIITIGKTVQYAMQSATPVYCYDHFGGPGYLNEENFERVSSHGFSGKGFSKMSAALIVKSIIQQYQQAQEAAEYIQKKHSTKYLLPEKIDMVLKIIEQPMTNKKHSIAQSQIESFYAINEMFWAYHKLSKHLTIHTKNLEQHTKNLEQHTKNLEQQLIDMQNSTSWVLTKPLRISKAWILVATKILKIRK